MDPTVVALVAAGIGAAAGLGGQFVAGMMTRRRERDAWLRLQRMALYTDMLVWAQSMAMWLRGDIRIIEIRGGPGPTPPPFPERPSPELLARAELVASNAVRRAWQDLSLSDLGLRAMGMDSEIDLPLTPKYRADLEGMLGRLVTATQSDPALGLRLSVWRRRLVRRVAVWRVRIKLRCDSPGG